MDIYEISLLDRMEAEIISQAISVFLQIPRKLIGSEREYFEESSVGLALEVGIEVHYQYGGYETLIEIIITHDLGDSLLFKMSCYLATTLQTSVVIGNLILSEQLPIGEFAIIDPYGNVTLAYEKNDLQGNFDLQPTKECMTRGDYLSLILSKSSSPSKVTEPDHCTINHKQKQPRLTVNKALYEGVYCQAPNPKPSSPEYYAVVERAPRYGDDDRVIKIPTLEVKEDTLFCEYEILRKGITEEVAEYLILETVLDDFSDRYYADKVSVVEFINMTTNQRTRVPYGNVANS